MAKLYYLDIETTGFNPKKDKIITIQFQQIHPQTKEPINKLEIVEEWVFGEKEMLKIFWKKFNNVWDFIPIGTNLRFDFGFIYEKLLQYNLINGKQRNFIYEKPHIDLSPVLILINNLSFKGSGLDNMTKKEQTGKNIPFWYENKKYDKIIAYIKQETTSFLEAFKIIADKLPLLKEELKQ